MMGRENSALAEYAFLNFFPFSFKKRVKNSRKAVLPVWTDESEGESDL